MSATLYNSGPTSNDLLARLISEQAALHYQVIACGANDAKNIENCRQSPVQESGNGFSIFPASQCG